MLFRPQDETQNKSAMVSSWFALSESLTSNLEKSAETRTVFPNIIIKCFDK